MSVIRGHIEHDREMPPKREKTDEEWRAEGYEVKTFGEIIDEIKKEEMRDQREPREWDLYTIMGQWYVEDRPSRKNPDLVRVREVLPASATPGSKITATTTNPDTDWTSKPHINFFKRATEVENKSIKVSYPVTIEAERDRFVKAYVSAALNLCEKYGYPTYDEPLCLIVEDSVLAGYDAASSRKVTDLSAKELLEHPKVRAVVDALISAHVWDEKESPGVAWTQNYMDEVKSPRDKAFSFFDNETT